MDLNYDKDFGKFLFFSFTFLSISLFTYFSYIIYFPFLGLNKVNLT